MQTFDKSDLRIKRSSEASDVINALDAVCNELGIARFERARREAVAKRIEAAWKNGRTQPLYLVDAGLGEFRG